MAHIDGLLVLAKLNSVPESGSVRTHCRKLQPPQT
jgi:hypothetical protein